MIKLMKRVLDFSGSYRKRIIWAFIISFLKGMLAKAPMMLAFFVLAAFYNKEEDAKLCGMIGLAMLACLVIQIILHNAADRLQSGAGYEIFADMRMKLGARLRKMPMGYFTEGNIGKISSVLSSDMVFIEENCMTVIAEMMNYVFSELIMLAFMLYFNIWLGLAASLTALIVVIVARGMRKDALARSAVRQEQNERMTDAILDFTEGIGIAKTYNLLGEKSKELTDNFNRTCQTSLDFERSQDPWACALYVLYGVGAALIALVSVALCNASMLEAPMAVGALLFVFDIFGPLKALYSQGTRLTVMNSCMDRIEAVFAESELPDTGTERLPESCDAPELEFKDVRFSYGKKEVLHGISFKLEKNKMLALVGPSGSGKSTIANLIARFWDADSGEILLRGRNIRKLPLRSLMGQISMVFQRVYLFRDTVYNNIAMGRPSASREEVIEAAKKARCYDFIMALPDGFETVIGEGGESLSGGEKQRISIARCILKDAPIVILDEATANVDADNESYIQEAISELCRGKTLIVIAHRLNTIRGADKILVISDGAIAQSGTHDELIAQDGIYRSFITKRSVSGGWNRRTSA